MLLWLLTWFSCVAITTASLQSCPAGRFEDAFLANVTYGLPLKLRRDFCARGGTNVVIYPQDVGIAHYVLTGSIVTDQLGKDQEGHYNTLQLGEVAPLGAAQTPVSLHLWIRALCDGYGTEAVLACSCLLHARHAS